MVRKLPKANVYQSTKVFPKVKRLGNGEVMAKQKKLWKTRQSTKAQGNETTKFLKLFITQSIKFSDSLRAFINLLMSKK